MNWKNNCVNVRNGKCIPLKDKNCKSQFRIENKNEIDVRVITIDGCQILEGRRCDYLVDIPSLKKAFFVELKGSDFEHGISQLEETLKKYSKVFKEHDVICYVICSQFPRAATKKQIFQKRFKKAYERPLRIERTPYVEAI